MLLALLLLMTADVYDVRGTLVPVSKASVALHGSTTPFEAATLADVGGQFRFRAIEPGTYTLSVFVPGRGETRKTIEVGPSTADKQRRVRLLVRLDESKMAPDRSSLISMRQLSIPQKAKDEYEKASKSLGERDSEAAVAHLKKAVELAPQFAEAWNHLGTIAYQTKRYEDAEGYFRHALEADPDSYAPLVNLGGVLVTLGRWDEAWTFNLNAVLRQPADALAQSQMGMTYFGLRRMDLAEKYLLEAVRLDAGHFSHPQLLLAEIYLRRGEKAKASDQLEDFLRHHPDNPGAGKMREAIDTWRELRKN
jgi:tetratricopeptide (TPR) repeat protein